MGCLACTQSQARASWLADPGLGSSHALSSGHTLVLPGSSSPPGLCPIAESPAQMASLLHDGGMDDLLPGLEARLHRITSAFFLGLPDEVQMPNELNPSKYISLGTLCFIGLPNLNKQLDAYLA